MTSLIEFQNKIISNLLDFSSKVPEIVFEWTDSQSNATGYLVINSLTGNAAGGGTRLHQSVTKKEIIALSKTMEIKFMLSGPKIGGAKSGIRLDGQHPQKYEILAKWYHVIKPILETYYGTGSDLNTDINRINNILNDIGIPHPQYGIIYSLYRKSPEKLKEAFNNLNFLNQIIKINNITLKLSDLVTGYGVVAAIKHYTSHIGDVLVNKRAFVQGSGNVGAAVAYYMHVNDSKIVIINEKEGGIYRPNGLNLYEILEILKNRTTKNIQGFMSNIELNKIIKNESLDIFIPAADSNIVDNIFVDNLMSNGLKILACGSNNPFIEDDVIYGRCSQFIDKNIALLPDFLCSSGMARTFFKLMSSAQDKISIDYIFEDISSYIKEHLNEALKISNSHLITASLYNHAFKIRNSDYEQNFI